MESLTLSLVHAHERAAERTDRSLWWLWRHVKVEFPVFGWLRESIFLFLDFLLSEYLLRSCDDLEFKTP